jgi:aryl-alcohol dehydrogenase-like predicted oxidoreductase
VRYRSFGRAGWEVSEVGLGTYPLGGALVTSGRYWSGPATYGAVAPETALETLRAGMAGGLTFIDTAPNYGRAEELIGQALAGRGEPRCLVATKCGEHVRASGGERPELARDFSRAALRRSVARSRERLRCARLDLVMLHSPGPDELDEDPLGLLTELREEGVVERIGESAASVARAIELVEGDARVDAVQVPFSLLQPDAAARLLPLAAERGVAVVVRQPLASGFLSGLIDAGHVFAPDDYRSTMPRERIAERARQARAFAFLVDEGIATSLPEAALRYVLGFPAVSCVIPGAMRPDELRANLTASGTGPLPDEALRRVEAAQREIGLLRS